MRIAIAALLAMCATASADRDDDDSARASLEAHDHVVRVPTRKGVEVPVLVRDADKPKGIVLLYPGGGGQLGLTDAGLAHGADNFTVRTRGLFANAGFVAIVVDAPSDHRESLSAYRISADAADDTAKLAAWASAKWHAPVWLVGTSRGTISVGNAAARGVAVHGIVLTSSVTTGAREKSTLGDVAVGTIAVPVLLVHHIKDGCNASPIAGAIELKRKLAHAKDIGWREISGGETELSASKCSPRSHHGYLGQDAEVVAAIVDYMARD
jgi:hypothetical protein